MSPKNQAREKALRVAQESVLEVIKRGMRGANSNLYKRKLIAPSQGFASMNVQYEDKDSN